MALVIEHVSKVGMVLERRDKLLPQDTPEVECLSHSLGGFSFPETNSVTSELSAELNRPTSFLSRLVPVPGSVPLGPTDS